MSQPVESLHQSLEDVCNYLSTIDINKKDYDHVETSPDPGSRHTPTDILQDIFRLLDLYSFMQASATCKRWETISSTIVPIKAEEYIWLPALRFFPLAAFSQYKISYRAIHTKITQSTEAFCSRPIKQHVGSKTNDPEAQKLWVLPAPHNSFYSLSAYGSTLCYRSKAGYHFYDMKSKTESISQSHYVTYAGDFLHEINRNPITNMLTLMSTNQKENQPPFINTLETTALVTSFYSYGNNLAIGFHTHTFCIVDLKENKTMPLLTSLPFQPHFFGNGKIAHLESPLAAQNGYEKITLYDVMTPATAQKVLVNGSLIECNSEEVIFFQNHAEGIIEAYNGTTLDKIKTFTIPESKKISKICLINGFVAGYNSYGGYLWDAFSGKLINRFHLKSGHCDQNQRMVCAGGQLVVETTAPSNEFEYNETVHLDLLTIF